MGRIGLDGLQIRPTGFAPFSFTPAYLQYFFLLPLLSSWRKEILAVKGRDLIVCLEAAQEAARRGAVVLEEWRHRFSIREKARFDLVTEADLASQKAIQEYLQYHFPDHAFLGEEQSVGWVESSAPTADRTIKSIVSSEDSTHPTIKSSQTPTWIVDPLDGTTNYVHDCPLYCVSIGLMVEGELVVGVVFDPVRQ